MSREEIANYVQIFIFVPLPPYLLPLSSQPVLSVCVEWLPTTSHQHAPRMSGPDRLEVV